MRTINIAENQAELIAKAPIVDVDIDKLHLDPDNVRFRHLPKRPTAEQIEKIIKNDPETLELTEQILAAGVIYEPLVIDSNYVVIEGNRRLVALRTLKEEATRREYEDVPKGKFDKVRCRILPPGANDQGIDLYLATIHVKGKKPWKLFNRSKHIYRLNRIHGMSYEEIARTLGMGKVTVQRSIHVYHLINEYSRTFPKDPEWFHKYTYYDELFKRKDLQEYRDDKSFVAKFGSWVNTEKFRDVRDVRKLAEIMKDDDAMSVFEKFGIVAALEALEKKNPASSNQEFKKIKDTISVLKSIPRAELEEIKANPAKSKMLIELESEIKKVIAELEAMRTIGKSK